MRLTRSELFSEMAKLIAQRGTCLRAQVGAVVVKENRVVAMGYNGSLPGAVHCNSDTCTPDSPCKNSVHAEANLIAFCAKKGISLEDGWMYCTHSPCVKCTELIIQAGIRKVFFQKLYRESDLTLLTNHGVSVEYIEPYI
jgi:dCMP deaminase